MQLRVKRIVVIVDGNFRNCLTYTHKIVYGFEL